MQIHNAMHYIKQASVPQNYTKCILCLRFTQTNTFTYSRHLRDCFRCHSNRWSVDAILRSGDPFLLLRFWAGLRDKCLSCHRNSGCNRQSSQKRRRTIWLHLSISVNQVQVTISRKNSHALGLGLNLRLSLRHSHILVLIDTFQMPILFKLQRNGSVY